LTTAIAFKLAAILATVALGWLAGRLNWLAGAGVDRVQAARVLSDAAFYVFVPALLFRTTVRLDLASLPGPLLLAFFVPVTVLLLAVNTLASRRAGVANAEAAAPATRAVTATFANSVQLGIPMAAALFGEAGLALHIALVSLHALVLLTVATVLAELALARQARREGASAGLGAVVAQTARQTLIHPVVLPILAGLAWNLTGVGLHPVVDEVLVLLAQAVVPLCLVLIGLALAAYGIQAHWRGAVGLVLLKLLVAPALVLAAGHWVFGLQGLPLAVIVMLAALPVGSNALIFAQRYRVQEAEATAAIVVSTVAFVGSSALWLVVLQTLGVMS
jgi:malonate transporter and related proteins